MIKEYALYKGEELLSKGTLVEIAREMNVAVRSIYHFTTGSYKRKVAKKNNPSNSRVLIPLFKEEVKVEKKVTKVIDYGEDDFYPNTNKPYTMEDQNYIIKWYDRISGEEMAMAIGRKPETLTSKVRDLRKQGLMPAIGMGKGIKVRY